MKVVPNQSYEGKFDVCTDHGDYIATCNSRDEALAAVDEMEEAEEASDPEDHYLELFESAQRIDRKVFPEHRVDHQRFIASLRGNHSVGRTEILRRHAGL